MAVSSVPDLTLGQVNGWSGSLDLNTDWKLIAGEAGVSALYLNAGLANFQYSHDGGTTPLVVNTNGFSISLWSQSADGTRPRKVWVRVSTGTAAGTKFEAR